MSQLNLKECESWDQYFFEQFVSCKNHFYANDPYFLKEEINEFSLFLQRSPLDFQFKAMIFFKEKQFAGRILLVMQKEQAVLKWGYFECLDEQSVCQEIFNQAFLYAKKVKAKTIKGPIQFNFFNSYRLKISGFQTRLYGEPYHKEYYYQLLIKCGLQQSNYWVTSLANFEQSEKDYTHAFKSKKIIQNEKLSIRPINKREWNNELKIVYNLFINSYTQMKEFEIIEFDLFSKLYTNFKYLVNSHFCFFTEYEKYPIGFTICFFNPFPLLLDYQKKCTQHPIFSWWYKFKLLYQLKVNKKDLLILYIGKVSHLTEETKGVQLLSGIHLKKELKKQKVPDVYICFLAEDSPARYMLTEENATTVAEYCVFENEV